MRSVLPWCEWNRQLSPLICACAQPPMRQLVLNSPRVTSASDSSSDRAIAYSPRFARLHCQCQCAISSFPRVAPRAQALLLTARRRSVALTRAGAGGAGGVQVRPLRGWAAGRIAHCTAPQSGWTTAALAQPQRHHRLTDSGEAAELTGEGGRLSGLRAGLGWAQRSGHRR